MTGINLTDQSKKILETRYFLRGDDGEVLEDVEGMFWRVSKAVAEGEVCNCSTGKKAIRHLEDCLITKYTDLFYDLMSSFKFLPNSPTLMNAGTEQGSLSACFVLPLKDSMQDIMKTATDIAMVQKFGGGTGVSLSLLRSKGSSIASTHGRACGPIEVLKVLSSVSSMITQGGKRDGANMATMSIDHPDILQFIHCKDQGGIHNFNISVTITEEFMRCLLGCEFGGWKKEDPDGWAAHNCYYNIIDPHTGQAVDALPACDVFQEICESAWKTGDPGIMFIDRVNNSRSNPIPSLGPILGSNPCGEQNLYDYDSCNLGSVNLGKFFIPYTKAVEQMGNSRIEFGPEIDWKDLEKVVRLSVRFLDNVIDVSPYPLPEIKTMNQNIRRIGLGVMGWADLLALMKIPYNSPQALDLAREVMGNIQKWADHESEKLAAEKGMFPFWDKSIYNNLGSSQHIRNSCRTTVAPTGTISLIAGCSSGIEPFYELEYTHGGLEGKLKDIIITNPILEKSILEGWYKTEYVLTAHEIDPQDHINMQSVFQEYIDNAISKTINLNEDATVEDIKEAYLYAYQKGCKSTTIFRNNCRSEQVLNSVNDRQKDIDEAMDGNYTKEAQNVTTSSLVRDSDKVSLTPIPKIITSKTIREKFGDLGNIHVTITEIHEGDPVEVFTQVSKAGSDALATTEAIGRLISLLLRLEVLGSREERLGLVVEQLQGIGGSSSYGFGDKRVKSLPDGISKALDNYLKVPLSRGDDYWESAAKEAQWELDNLRSEMKNSGNLCPECGNNSLRFSEGCESCPCGFSRC